MKILVTNDDGIYARGIWALAWELSQVGQVLVVAPDREQSGVGTSVTLHTPIRAREVEPLVEGIETYSVEGTPADSVIFALGTVAKNKPDVLVSGINEGANLGNDVLISGTVAAALQGYFYGLPSLAISVAAMEDLHFDAAARLARLLVEHVAAGKMPPRVFLNVNLPNRPAAEIEGIELTRLGERAYQDEIKEGHDGKRTYYWIVRGTPVWSEEPGTDIWALRRGRVSITPLQSDLSSCDDPTPLAHICQPLLSQLHEVS